MSFDLHLQRFSPSGLSSILSYDTTTEKRQISTLCWLTCPSASLDMQDHVSSVFISWGGKYLKCLQLQSSHLTVTRSRSSWLSLTRVLFTAPIKTRPRQAVPGSMLYMSTIRSHPKLLPQKNLWGQTSKLPGDSDTNWNWEPAVYADKFQGYGNALLD